MSTLDEIRVRDATTTVLVESQAMHDRRTLLALLDAQSLELQAVREALRRYGKHCLSCASQWPSEHGEHQSCNCGFDAALKQSRGAT